MNPQHAIEWVHAHREMVAIAMSAAALLLIFISVMTTPTDYRG